MRASAVTPDAARPCTVGADVAGPINETRVISQGRDWFGRCDMSDEKSNLSLEDSRFLSMSLDWVASFRMFPSFEAVLPKA
ncbi:hypothetical protein [Methylorubrum zatmanii]